MIKRKPEELAHMEELYPGIIESIMRFENADLPPCVHCGSENTASVQVGVIGRTMHIDVSTTKIRLLLNGPKPGKYYCNACKKYYD